jgi:hypothetical protein
MVKSSFVLENEDMDILRAIAEQHGCTSKRGPLAGKGSPQPLVDDIVSGRLLVIENPEYTNGTS